MQRRGNQINVFQADVSLATFDAADITAVETDAECELFLAPTSVFAKLAHAISEKQLDVAVGHNGGIVFLDDHASTDLKSRKISGIGKGSE